MELASTHAKSLIDTLLHVHALANMYRASKDDEYRRAAAHWLDTLETQMSSLRRELTTPSVSRAASIEVREVEG